MTPHRPRLHGYLDNLDSATLARHWPVAVFACALIVAVDPDPRHVTVAAFATALLFGLWTLQMALNLVVSDLFSWWESSIAAVGVIAVVWGQLWLSLPGIGHIDGMVGDPAVHTGYLAMALVLLPVATAYLVKLLWHVGVARAVARLDHGQFESWAADHARVTRWSGEDGRRRIVDRHLARVVRWRPYAAGAVLVVGYGALAGLWAPAAQLLVAALVFAVPWVLTKNSQRNDAGPVH